MSAANPRPLVLDSWAVAAHFQGIAAAAGLAGLISETLKACRPVAMTAVNVGEVWHTIARAATLSDADDAVVDMRCWGVEFVDADWPLAHAAAVIRTTYCLSYANAFAAALAKERRADLVTGDPEFHRLEGTVRVAWMKAGE